MSLCASHKNVQGSDHKLVIDQFRCIKIHALFTVFARDLKRRVSVH